MIEDHQLASKRAKAVLTSAIIQGDLCDDERRDMIVRAIGFLSEPNDGSSRHLTAPHQHILGVMDAARARARAFNRVGRSSSPTRMTGRLRIPTDHLQANVGDGHARPGPSPRPAEAQARVTRHTRVSCPLFT